MTDDKKQKVDQRQVARRQLSVYLRIFDGMGSHVLGHLVDISDHGLMMLSDEPLAVNGEYRLRMRLPVKFSGRDEIVLVAVSRWCRQDRDPDFYVNGLQIEDIDEEARITLSRLVAEFGTDGSD
ncbi:MAG: PilZ domain-containing protein [Desulfobulbaceae bacterium]|nr:PilZ domain-containing protein [Desulfobulbaceae bacterium]